MIRIILADDHALVREGIHRILSAHSDMKVVAQAATGDEVIAHCEGVRADVLLLDVSMPGPGFLAVLNAVCAMGRVRVLVVSAHAESRYARTALRAGAAGYLPKEHSADELAIAVRRVASGGRYISPRLADLLADDLVASTNNAGVEPELSARELQVIGLIGAGVGVKEIAAQLEISPKTVSTYRRRLLDKLSTRFHSRAHQVRRGPRTRRRSVVRRPTARRARTALEPAPSHTGVRASPDRADRTGEPQDTGKTFVPFSDRGAARDTPHRYKIVIADDSARLRDRLRESLDAIDGIQVTGCATDGEEAIALVRQLKPDALVLDVRMPRASGFRVMEELRESNELPVVIVCTNHPFPEYKARAMALGATHFVDKGKDSRASRRS